MPTRNILLPLLLALLIAAPSRGQEGSQEAQMHSTVTYLVKMQINSPLMSSNAAIEKSVTKLLRQQIGERLAQDLGRKDLDAKALTPYSLAFSYSGADVTGMTHATLQLNFGLISITEGDFETLWEQLDEAAPPAVVEIFSQHLNDLFEQKHRADLDRMVRAIDEQKRELTRLDSRISELSNEQLKAEGGPIESSTTLQKHLQQLATRLREDAIRRVELEAQRAAIEERIDELHTHATEQQQADPLLAALEAEVGRHQHGLAEFRANLEKDSPVEAARQIHAAQDSLVKKLLAAHQVGNVTPSDLDAARAKLAEAHMRVVQTQADLRNQQALLEEKLAQAKIAYLKQMQATGRGRFSGQMNKLSELLDELVIEIESINGRHKGITGLVDKLTSDLMEQRQREANQQQLARDLHGLENQRAQAEQELMELEKLLAELSFEKIEIVPVIP